MENLSYSKRQQPGWMHYIRVQLDYPASVVTRNFETQNENISTKERIRCSAHEPHLEKSAFDLPVSNGQKPDGTKVKGRRGQSGLPSPVS